MQESNPTTLSSPRGYLLVNESTYDFFRLLNEEFTLNIDVSQIPRGIRVALYSSTTSSKGSANELNTAATGYGTKYCDAQCPQ